MPQLQCELNIWQLLQLHSQVRISQSGLFLQDYTYGIVITITLVLAIASDTYLWYGLHFLFSSSILTNSAWFALEIALEETVDDRERLNLDLANHPCSSSI